MSPRGRPRAALAWAAYDWANSAFSLTVVTAFLPVLLAGYWNDGAASAVTTLRLGIANGAASLVIAILAPLIGAFADAAGRRKALLLRFALLGVVMTGALYFVADGAWPLALAAFVLASVGFAGGNTLYDSLLVHVAPAGRWHRVSALGFALGYLGGALLFTVNVVMVLRPGWFGLPDATAAMRVAFLTVAAWWALFSLPLLLHVPEPPPAPGAAATPRAVFRELARTVRAILARRELALFLLAYWLYIDGVYTIIRMAVDFGLARGLNMQDLIVAILVTNFVGFPAALAFGWLGERIGPKRGIVIALVIYCAVTAAAATISTETGFYWLAAVIGLVQGGVQSLSRSLYALLVPAEQSGEYFGFYNVLGKFAAIIGPVLTGVVAWASGSQAVGILSILVLLVAGLMLLLRVPEPRA